MIRRSLCNELFGNLPFWKQCEITRQAGLEGIEIAPFTIADEAFLFPAYLADELKGNLEDFGLGFAGLHWLLTKPDGLLLTSRNKEKRQEAVDFLVRLADFSDRLGGGVMTLGGPKQRHAEECSSIEEAIGYLNEAFVAFGEKTKGYISKLAIEALSGDQTNVVNTFQEGRKVLVGTDDSRVTSMFDFHNTTEETEAWDQLVRKNMDIISHVHVNRMDGSCPGESEVETYRSTFQALEAMGYQGWYSLEDFSKPEDPLKTGIAFRQFMEAVLK